MFCFNERMNNFIPVNVPYIGKREKELVMECLETGWISSEGPFVSKFEDNFSNRVSRKYGIACSSGSAALDLAISALRLKKGQEVILPAFTIISCAQSIVRAGAIPKVIDCDPYSWNMRPDLIENQINSKTAAIMIVHIYGLPVDIDPILSLAKKYNLKVIEDAAEIIGGNYKGKPCGSFGTISTVSFYPNKHVTTGEGGMVLTDDAELAERCKSLRNLCFQKNNRFIHEELGWNYRMTNIQAALGIAQLERLDESIKKKIEIGSFYNKLLSDVDEITLPIDKLKYADNLYWVYGILLDKKKGNSHEFIKELKKSGIGSRPFFYPIHKQPVFKKMGLFLEINEKFIAEELYEQGLYLPCGLNINETQIKSVVDKVKNLLSK
tara:strand:- start:1063 stop:2205 length:1143 start_codon:yes stop_codon:yes gene_type:complete